MLRDTRPIVLRTADGLSLTADAWLTPTPASAAVMAARDLAPRVVVVGASLGAVARAPLRGRRRRLWPAW